uniref:RAD51 associated protein 1 n=1 Tax=Neogobius melanostomus TaxID=47308 RepID=A0A8C6T625_9GOBI
MQYNFLFVCCCSDEDFAKAPPRKKPKEAFNNKTSIICQEPNSQSLPSQMSRKPLDMKIYERDLDAAITLSLLNPSNKTSDQSPTFKVDENTEPSVLHLSNCSVDVVCLGLDQITSDSTAPSKERKDASYVQRNKLKTQDDDYQPCVASDSESDNDYSEHESEDEEFTVKRKAKQKGNIIFACVCLTVVSTPTRTPLTTKNISEPTRSVSMKVSKPAVCLSPGVSRVPKWNPPGQIGKSPSSSNSATVRSPGQGLRLGLSRLVRVKPLHSSVPSH